ncbi:hypothetical protein LIA77_04441 [Sarocladium implicatum]|nr:hypothetical protein LIA77_04441 [Sarocladium implicatum]
MKLLFISCRCRGRSNPHPSPSVNLSPPVWWSAFLPRQTPGTSSRKNAIEVRQPGTCVRYPICRWQRYCRRPPPRYCGSQDVRGVAVCQRFSKQREAREVEIPPCPATAVGPGGRGRYCRNNNRKGGTRRPTGTHHPGLARSALLSARYPCRIVSKRVRKPVCDILNIKAEAKESKVCHRQSPDEHLGWVVGHG